jgi:diacylglycerol kinase (ATP)
MGPSPAEPDARKGWFGLLHVIEAACYSLAGLRTAFRKEVAFRQELVLFLVLAPLGASLGRGGTDRALLVGSLFLVLITELVNSAIEAVVDRFGGERHELSKHAKDMGSAAVFLAVANSVVTWAFVLGARFG